MRGLTHFNPFMWRSEQRKAEPWKLFGKWIIWWDIYLDFSFIFQMSPNICTSFERLSEENKSQDSHELCGTKSFYIRQHFSNKKYKNVNDIVTVSSHCIETCRRCFTARTSCLNTILGREVSQLAVAVFVETTWWHLAKVSALSNMIYRSVSCSVLWCSCINHDAKRCSCFAIIISKNVILYRTYLLNTVRWMFAVASRCC